MPAHPLSEAAERGARALEDLPERVGEGLLVVVVPGVFCIFILELRGHEIWNIC